MLASADDGTGVLLGDGEAAFSPDGATTWTAIALAESGGGAAAPMRLAVVALAPAAGGDGFAPGAGLHDVELRRTVVAVGAPSSTHRSPALAS